MNLEEAWFIIYTERIPELPEEKRHEMARSAAARGDVPPPSRVVDPPTPSLSEVVVGSVGYVGAAEVWDLRRRLVEKGGLAKILDFFPGQKEQALNILGMIGGIGGMATVLAAYFGSDNPDARLNFETLALAYGTFHYSAQQFSKRLAADREGRELKAVTIATAAASAPEEAANVVAAGALVAIEKKPPKEEQRT